jgi:hypothetical protein
MNQRFKVPGIAAMAVLALLALPALAQGQFTSNKEHTVLSGSQKFGTNATFSAGSGFGGITCTTATVSGTFTGTSVSTAVITPEAETCKDSFGRSVDGNNSELTLTFTSGAGKGTAHLSGAVTLLVTSGGSVVCTIEIEAQNSNNGVSYTNLGGTSGVEVTIHSTNLKNTTSGGFFNCGVSNGEHTSGTYDGVFVVTGEGPEFSAASISVD